MEDIGAWMNFLSAAAGVSGGITGLIFIALSINLTHIMRLPETRGYYSLKCVGER